MRISPIQTLPPLKDIWKLKVVNVVIQKKIYSQLFQITDTCFRVIGPHQQDIEYLIYRKILCTIRDGHYPKMSLSISVEISTYIYIHGQKSSATTFSDISHLMKKACMIKLKMPMCLLICQLNTSMILKEITLMNTWKIRLEHGHPLVFYFTRFDQITHKS